MLRLTINIYLRQHHISITRLANAIADVMIYYGKTISERHLRNIAKNTALLTPDNEDAKPSLEAVGYIIAALRHLTGETVTITDVLEYVPIYMGAPQPTNEAVRSGGAKQTGRPTAPSQTNKPVYDLVAVPSETDTDELPDNLWELVAQSLRDKGYANLLIPATSQTDNIGGGKSHGTTQPRTKRFVSPILLALLIASLGFIAYDNFIVKPRLIDRFYRLVSFRDRVRPTSSLAVPTLIGPEGLINQLTPVLRISEVPEAQAYEFIVKNLVSFSFR